ncbi:hypothetical protein AJ79_01559 [Helicocarpus griseus UAMH5409]|uniref:DUF7770 domain-containing protein n=1 Tax=Helicocarpus griseus UAMH5409 TaxID=1447875 RepID=A0A2B7Y7U8_9EURO|nr:hypothetical protein AJ79_01559 [Helicocarpus griseus UAMH5409]
MKTTGQSTSYFRIKSSSGIKINASEYASYPGEVKWLLRDHTAPRSMVFKRDFIVFRAVTVAHIASLIYSLGRNQFNMLSGDGCGCRWWVYNVICDLARWDYVVSQAPDEIHGAMLFHYHASPNLHRVPTVMVYGIFTPIFVESQITGAPSQQVVKITVNGREQSTPLTEWVPYHPDANGKRRLCNWRYNLLINDPTQP